MSKEIIFTDTDVKNLITWLRQYQYLLEDKKFQIKSQLETPNYRFRFKNPVDSYEEVLNTLTGVHKTIKALESSLPNDCSKS